MLFPRLPVPCQVATSSCSASSVQRWCNHGRLGAVGGLVTHPVDGFCSHSPPGTELRGYIRLGVIVSGVAYGEIAIGPPEPMLCPQKTGPVIMGVVRPAKRQVACSQKLVQPLNGRVGVG